MADPVRLTILEALETTLEGITTANGYRINVANVEVEAKQWDQVPASERPWIGIVPQREGFKDYPGRTENEWFIDLLVYQTLSAKTLTAAAAACTNAITDIRRALYETANLGVAGMHFVMIREVVDSLGAPEARKAGVAAMAVGLTLKFEEGIYDT